MAIDVGTGTQDIIIYEPGIPLENCVKMVLPSPTVLVANKIKQITQKGRPLGLEGVTMGGGPCSKAVRQHLAAGLPVYATEKAALTIGDNLAEVEESGVQIVAELPPDVERVWMGDVDLQALQAGLAPFGITLPQQFAVAVQDHGFAPNESNRDFRFKLWRDFLSRGGWLKDLVYREVPAVYTRMRSVQEIVPGAVLMDTGGAAVWGALCDPVVRAKQAEGFTLLNIGNGHTIAFLVRGEQIWGLFEHHTRSLTPEKLVALLTKLQSGKLAHEEVYDDGGHGASVQPEFAQLPPGCFNQVVVTGPNRGLAKGMGYYFAVPGGDMMLSGSFGLLAGGGFLPLPEI